MESRWKKLTKSDYERIAKKEGLTNSRTYVQFMAKRFPDERCEGYAGEWARRFASGTPESYMDLQSQRDYEKVKKLKEVM